MKNYKKEYENVFRNPRSLKKFKVEKVEILEGIDFDEYVTQLKDLFGDYQKSLFDNWVKLDWMLRKFSYEGKKKDKAGRVGWPTELAYSIFMRNIIGVDNKFLRKGTSAYSQISSYFDDFFKDFDFNDPFLVEYEFPYKHINLNYLIFVYQMDERLELLEEAENRKMELAEFYDYIINYSSCLNNDIGEEKYHLSRTTNYLPYIIKNKL